MSSFLNNPKLSNSYPNYSLLFDFSNEDINGYVPYFDDVECSLVIGGSGDQSLNLVHNGAKKIDVFDKNFLVKYLLDLKVAAVLCLNYEEFNRFFDTFDPILFAKIKVMLPPESTYYWEKLYSKTRELNVTSDMVPSTICSLLFSYKKVTKDSRYKLNNYLLSEKEYNILKDKLLDCIIRFIPADFYSIDKSLDGRKYGTVLLSNILEYLPSNKDAIVNEIEAYINYLKTNIVPLLTENGKILISYCYLWDEKIKSEFKNEYERIGTVCQNGDIKTPFSMDLQQRGLTSRNLLYYKLEDILPKDNVIFVLTTHYYNDGKIDASDRAIIYSKKRTR